MAVYEVYSHSELRRYRTHICSKASIVFLFCLLLTWIPPLLIVYRSQGFWLRLDTYAEQPSVNFKYQLIFMMDINQNGDYVAWSTYPNFNELQMENLRVPLIKAREDDTNGDGRNDALQFQLSMPLLDTERVYNVKCLLFFNYLLQKYSYFEMESMAYIHHNSPVPGASLQTTAELRLQQNQPLGHAGVDARFNTSIVNTTSIFASSFELPHIFEQYSKRNVSTMVHDKYPTWTSSRGTGRPFVLSATINYPEEFDILFTPGFWQLVKWGWVQYLSVLVVFWFVFQKIKIFIYSNQIVTTMVERPFKSKSL